MTQRPAPDVDVVVVGAGMAGLSAAIELHRAGLRVLLLDQADAPGGRVRTDVVDGFRLDRGFQLINPSYPQLGRLQRTGVLDLAALRLGAFDAGVRVALQHRHWVLADPRRNPADLLETVRAPLGSPLVKARLAGWALRCAVRRPAALLAAPDEPYSQTLDRAGITGALRTGVLDPFLAGVLGEDAGQSSSRFVSMVMRSFLRASPAVPADGMQALPDQLAGALPAGTLRTGVRVESVTDGVVRTSAGRYAARAVLVAADPVTAAGLTGLPTPSMHGLSTYWYACESSPADRPILHVDGLRRGPIVNAAVLSDAAPTYAPAGRALIACNTLGTDSTGGNSAGGAADEITVRRHAALLFGLDAANWQCLRVDRIPQALPAMNPPLNIRQPVRLDARLWVAGDHRDSASLQGALASGYRAARRLSHELAANALIA